MRTPVGPAHALRSWTALVGLAFLFSYFAVLLSAGGSVEPSAGVIMTITAIPLVISAWPHVSRFVRAYALVILAGFGVVVLIYPMNLPVLFASMRRLVSVIGLLAILGALAVPLQDIRYRAALRGVFGRLTDWGVRDTAAASILAFALGQVLAFSVVPLVDEFLGGDEHGRSVVTSRWSTRGFSLTLLAAITFPSVSVAIDIFGVNAGRYLMLASPLAVTLLCAAVLLSRRDSLAEVHPAAVEGWDRTTLTLVAGYFILMLGSVLLLPRWLDVTYLGIVSLSVIAAASLLSAVGWVTHRSSGGARLARYCLTWWQQAPSAIVIFFGSGVLLYVLETSELLASLAAAMARLATSSTLLLPPVFSGMVFVLCLVGVSPIVTIHIVAFTLAGSALTDMSMLALTVALMTGNVAALPMSPFSALTNLRAIMTSTDALAAPAENLWFSIGVLLAGNAYAAFLQLMGV